MRATNFSQVLVEAAQFCGLDRQNLTAADFAMIRDFASQRLAFIWESEFWPDLLRVEKVFTNAQIVSVSNATGLQFAVRSFTPPVAVGATVRVTGVTGTGEDGLLNATHPVTAVTGAAPDFVITVATPSQLAIYSVPQTNATLKATTDPDLVDLENPLTPALAAQPVGELLDVYHRDPLTDGRATSILERLLTYRETACAKVTTPGSVWIKYRLRSPHLTGDSFDPGVDYYPGAQIWFDTGGDSGLFTPAPGKPFTGNFYTCTTATTAGQTPLTQPSRWELVKIPAIFGKYLTRAVAADYLRSEAQFDQSAAMEADAESLRVAEIDKLLRQQGQDGRLNMTYTY